MAGGNETTWQARVWPGSSLSSRLHESQDAEGTCDPTRTKANVGEPLQSVKVMEDKEGVRKHVKKGFENGKGSGERRENFSILEFEVVEWKGLLETV